ncbi:Conidiation protein 6-domain-containing protein [Coniochaeta sp. 2T2.1]|nr:Conidiation protein 6-domain-containing protein [Coniochaeta sp. 2T2.1]
MPRESQIAGGHKANLNNPNTSDESKEHSKQVLEDQFDGVPSAADSRGKNPGNVAGGLKATMKNPNVSDQAKKSAQDRLGDMEE